ncbi:MAG: CbiX/SirB N-terminal domain-containing protein [Andreesenia angusta]|nr:CbiX/SirB N-terminal domain-containing protein [Andreesenia angusta]
MKGVLVIGHGSRAKGTKEIFQETVSKLREKMKEDIVEGCFMELSEPLIPETVDNMYEKGVRKIVVLPYFLFPGIHILNDIPEILRAKKEEHEGLEIEFASPIGYDDKLVEILKDRAEGDKVCI